MVVGNGKNRYFKLFNNNFDREMRNIDLHLLMIMLKLMRQQLLLPQII